MAISKSYTLMVKDITCLQTVLVHFQAPCTRFLTNTIRGKYLT